MQAEEDDFEVVPMEREDGVDWDVDDEDQDMVKQEKIKSTFGPDIPRDIGAHTLPQKRVS